MDISDDIINILHKWSRATDEEVYITKQYLMPEDDISKIYLKVRDHVAVDKTTNTLYTWMFHVEVIYDGFFICDIIIDCETKKRVYMFT